MKFLLIKDLGDDQEPSLAWIQYHKRKLRADPVGLKAEYVKLVKSLRTLHTIEATLRKEVFGSEEAALIPVLDPLKFPNSGEAGFARASSLMGAVNAAMEVLFQRGMDVLLKKL